MRSTFALVLAVVLGACGGNAGGDDTSTPDGNTVDEPELRIESPDIDIQPGQEVTYCWYFRTSNTRPLAITQWQSVMSPGSHHLIMFLTKNDLKPVGTVSTGDCGAGPGLATYPTWAYWAEDAEAELRLPEDGDGKPLAMEIPANQAGFLQLHYQNSSDSVIKAHVVVTGQALDEGAAYTRTAAYVTFNGSIAIPPMTSGHVETETCNVSTESKFWLMTTHSHRRSVRTTVKDGMPNSQTLVFESTDWQHPGAARFDAPFHTFTTGKLTYECEYNNTAPYTVEDGDSAQKDEMCMAVGYFFPAAEPKFCYNSIVFPP